MNRTPLVVNGWALFAHPLFLGQVEALAFKVETLQKKDPKRYTKKNAPKRLAAIKKLITEDIPENPHRPEYRLGDTLDSKHKHWFRAVFFQQYRLFFRFHTARKIIVYGWINDEGTLRAYESKDDAYCVFKKMLTSGQPPSDWEQLLVEAKTSAGLPRDLLVGKDSE